MTKKTLSLADEVVAVLAGIEELIICKNRAYGDSAFNPLRVFAKDLDPLTQLKVRIDDKLSRIARGEEGFVSEDTIEDLIGYLVLYKIALAQGIAKFEKAISKDVLDHMKQTENTRNPKYRGPFETLEEIQKIEDPAKGDTATLGTATEEADGVASVDMSSKPQIKPDPVRVPTPVRCNDCGEVPTIYEDKQRYKTPRYEVRCDCGMVGSPDPTEDGAVEIWNAQKEDLITIEPDPIKIATKAVPCACGILPVFDFAGTWQWLRCRKCKLTGARCRDRDEAIESWNRAVSGKKLDEGQK